MRSRDKPGVGRQKEREWKNKGGKVRGMRGSPGRGGVDGKVELPMALNQLAPVPGSLWN